MGSEFEDIHIAASKPLFILSTHDDAVRARLASSDILTSCAVAMSRSALLKLRRAMIQITAYLCLDNTAVGKVWLGSQCVQQVLCFTYCHALGSQADPYHHHYTYIHTYIYIYIYISVVTTRESSCVFSNVEQIAC
jgi:hypothetical protein